MKNLILKKGSILLIVLVFMAAVFSTPAFAGTESTPTFTSRSEASEYYYNQMLNHAGNIKFTYVTANSNASEVCKFFNTDVFADDGDDLSLMGDYIRYGLYNGFSANYSSYKQGNQYYYTFNYKMSYKTTLAQDKKFEQKLSSVMSSLNLSGKNDYAKVKTIYDYICKNVKYDKKHNSSYYLKYTAYAALINKTSVCQGYANLFYRMCKYAGIPVRIVTGTSKGESHAWNIVKVDGKYYNADATWDAGESSYSYFLKSDSNFKDHTRNTEYKAASFKAENAMASSSYSAFSSAQPNLSAAKLTKTSAKLSWNKVSSADGYKVYRAASKNGTYKSIAKVGKNTVKYTNKKLTSGKTYYYKVKAYQNVNGKTVYSKVSAVKTVCLS